MNKFSALSENTKSGSLVQVQDLTEILSLTDQGILLLSEQNNIDYVNTAYFEIMGIPETIRNNLKSLDDFRYAFRFYSPHSKYIREDSQWQSFLKHLDLNNEIAVKSAQSISMGDRSIKYVRRKLRSKKTLECVFDITELHRQQKMLDQARIKALSADKAKSEFLANMSHEIRTPMTGV